MHTCTCNYLYRNTSIMNYREINIHNIIKYTNPMHISIKYGILYQPINYKHVPPPEISNQDFSHIFKMMTEFN